MLSLFEKNALKIGFVGFGKSSRGVYDYLSRHMKFDATLRSDTSLSLSTLPKFSKIICDNSALSGIDEDILFLSPSVRRDRPELICARERGTVISSDAELFFEANERDVYIVTGSDGKSTTAYITSELLKCSYGNAIPAGNFGEALAPHLDDNENTAIVAELSSFQLNYFTPKSRRAVITNITENHLNWHKSYSEYISAKKNALIMTDAPILSYDNSETRKIAQESGKVFALFSLEKSEEELRREIKSELYLTLTNGYISISGEPILETSKIKARGRHNILNFMSAIALSYGKCDRKFIENFAKNFVGLPHRCETVGIYSGVKYINSSIDSSPKRTIATLDSLSERVILILGGRGKGLDFSELIPSLKAKTKQIILTGESGLEILEVIKSEVDFHLPYRYVSDFYDAIEYAILGAREGDTVLLSPASTSYNCFKNFEERGDAFKRYIKKRNSK